MFNKYYTVIAIHPHLWSVSFGAAILVYQFTHQLHGGCTLDTTQSREIVSNPYSNEQRQQKPLHEPAILIALKYSELMGLSNITESP